MKNILQKILGLALFSCSLTVLFISMRAVMAVGGSCADGGPYAIATQCPGGTGYLTPLSIFAMLAGAAMYFLAKVKNSPAWGYFFWSALFLSLGWNFLQIGFFPGDGSGASVSWIICGVMFGLFGLAPIFGIQKVSFAEILLGKKSVDSGFGKFSESRVFLLVLHLIAAGLGVYLGILISR